MRICIDARSLRDVPTSLGRYAADLVSHIAKLDRENEYIVVRRPSRHGPIADQANFREIFAPHDISSAHNILAGARVINALDADVYHSLYHFLPIGVRARRVVITLHDLIWVDHSYLADGRRWRRWVKGSLGSMGIRRAIATADHIVAVSASTRQAALDHGVPADKVTAILHGVAPAWHSDNSEPAPFDLGNATDQDQAQQDILDGLAERPFAFGLGNSLPYKNLPRLVRAFAQVAPDSSRPRAGVRRPRRGQSPARAAGAAARPERPGAPRRPAQRRANSRLFCPRALFRVSVADRRIRAARARSDGQRLSSAYVELFLARRSRRRKRRARRSARHRVHSRRDAEPVDRFRAPPTAIAPGTPTGRSLHVGRRGPANHSTVYAAIACSFSPSRRIRMMASRPVRFIFGLICREL